VYSEIWRARSEIVDVLLRKNYLSFEYLVGGLNVSIGAKSGLVINGLLLSRENPLVLREWPGFLQLVIPSKISLISQSTSLNLKWYIPFRVGSWLEDFREKRIWKYGGNILRPTSFGYRVYID
jgi:hypothetical protein